MRLFPILLASLVSIPANLTLAKDQPAPVSQLSYTVKIDPEDATRTQVRQNEDDHTGDSDQDGQAP